MFMYRISLALLLLTAAAHPSLGQRDPLPYAAAGLGERDAAVHLLNRFAYGPRPGDVDRVVAMGLETWLTHQLAADLPDEALATRLASFEALTMPARELSRTYPRPTYLRSRAVRDSVVTREETASMDREALRKKMRAYMAEKGYRPLQALLVELYGQKLLRARYSENQLVEVLTDFWYNHFNVALQDNQARPYLFSYERDAIRPYVLGSFRDMLGATARHPAMLLYLDNARSTAGEDTPTTMAQRPWARRRARRGGGGDAAAPTRQPGRRGINENYARELMELHTLGVGGGYTQQDVEQVARAFTGWTVLPPGPEGDALANRIRQHPRAGFSVDGDFIFRANLHDATEKVILGTVFPAGGGLEEGERVLDLLAAHPATAHYLARKLAVRFVSDDPPPALVDTLAAVFLDTGGDLRAVMRALAYSPYFWAPAARQAKIKAPFELAASALRALDADIRDGRAVVRQIEAMGQPLYAYQAPTGFPDRADFWINTGTLVNRMNFAMALAAGRVRGVRVDLGALNRHREPADVEAALTTYVGLLLPGVRVAPLVEQLLPVAADPQWAEKLDAAGRKADGGLAGSDPDALARVVGVILGAPAFQRR